MKRYIISKEALSYLDREQKLATDELAKSIVITDETLVFQHIPKVSIVLSEEEVNFLKSKGFEVNVEQVFKPTLWAGDYEKVRSRYYKTKKKNLTGKGTKIAILDTGLATDIIPVEVAVNYADGGPVTGNPGHGTFVTSIIKDELIGLAPDAEVHFIKIYDSEGNGTESTILAAIDHCINNEIDIVNMSFAALWPNQETVNTCINAGIVMAAASGNSPADAQVSPPACFPGVVSVNAMTEAGGIGYFNIILPEPNTYNWHTPSVACSGRNCEGRFSNGQYGVSNGTSFSCPFFVGSFALYKEELGIEDNYKVLQHILNKAKKLEQPVYSGAGLLTF